MPPTRPRRKGAQLKRIARHVMYEISMMRATAIAAVGARDQFSKNVLIDDFLLHLRSVRDFFYADKPRKDDVIAEDFFSDPNRCQSARPPLSPIVRNNKTRIDRALAHLSYTRLKYKGRSKGWNIGGMVRGMERTIDSFIRALPPRRANWFT